MASSVSTVQIPTGWSLTKLGDVLTQNDSGERLNGAKLYRLLGVRLAGQGPFLREEKVGQQIQASHLSKVHTGDFIYSRLFAWRGAFGVIPEKLDGAYVSNEFPTFSVDRNRLDVDFLRLYFSQPPVWSEVETYCTGTTKASRNRFKEEFFLGMEIPFPPLDEQRRIVSRIEKLSAKIKEASELRKQSQREIDILFSKALKLAFQPYTAKTVRIGDVFNVTTGGTPSRSNPTFWNGQVKWVSSGEVAFGRITDTSEKITDLGLANSNAKVYPPKTVLIAMIGQGKTRGQCAILSCYASTNQNVAGIHVYETPHNPEFIYWWLYSRYQESRFAETGTAQPALSAERVKQMPIPLPSPEEQARTVGLLNALQQQVALLKPLQSETAAELDALMPSVLSRAFLGEL